MSYVAEDSITAHVDAVIYENPDQDITGDDFGGLFIDFIDSYAPGINPFEYFSQKITQADIASGSVTYAHGLGTDKLKPVMYNSDGKRLYNRYFDCQIDDTNVIITPLTGLPNNSYWKFYVYKLAL